MNCSPQEVILESAVADDRSMESLMSMPRPVAAQRALTKTAAHTEFSVLNFLNQLIDTAAEGLVSLSFTR